MCRAAISQDSFFEVDDMEMRRVGPSYTIDTARELHRRTGDTVSWLIGADMAISLPSWHEFGSLMAEINFVLMARPGWSLNWNAVPASLRQLEKNVVNAPALEISSTGLRERLARGQSIRYLTSDAVIDYIHQSQSLSGHLRFSGFTGYRRMEVAFLILLSVLGLANLIVCAMLFLRGRTDLTNLERSGERTERSLREEIARNREELVRSLNALSEAMLKRLTDFSGHQNTHLDQLSRSNSEQIEQMRQTIERRLSALQTDNSQKLELMRATVDEKLHATLEQRLGESFKLVSDRLELVHKGLGEMQTLAVGVGDLKKVLSNIKTRGNWGEVQLGNLLEQMLTPDQYAANVQVHPLTAERVDFAIKLPGRDGKHVWLAIDAKFPQEDYQRLVDAADRGDAPAVLACACALETRVNLEARKIRDKYIHPPDTTDFAILFLPTEGLFAEVLRRPGLCDQLLHEHRVVLAGPTTLAAVLSSLQMGFRTLVIEKRSSEVWQVLGGIKTEFGKFGSALEKVQKKLQEASNTMDRAATRSRAVERKLREVQEVSVEAVPKLAATDSEAAA